MHRRPCPFFRSVEFWTIAVKTLAIGYNGIEDRIDYLDRAKNVLKV